MQNKGLVIILLTLILLISPLSAMGEKRENKTEENNKAEIKITDKKEISEDTITVFSPVNKKAEKIDLFEYTVGAVAAEIPPTYHSEAIKAQAVAAYTYALKCKEEGRKNELDGAHLSSSGETHQGYIDKKERQKRWGKKYEIYENKIEDAVKEIWGKKIKYEGELIISAYHAISCGNTFSSKEVWGRDLPYLKSVTSAGDRLSPDYIETLIYTPEQFRKGAEKIDGLKIKGDPENWIGEIIFSDSGYTEYIEICDKKIGGKDLRQALNLKSANINIEYIDANFKITTKGNGHGVGMSQYGADYMARQGKTYEEILRHYYSGVEIE